MRMAVEISTKISCALVFGVFFLLIQPLEAQSTMQSLCNALGSIGIDPVICESCFKGTILHRSNSKITMIIFL